MIREIALFGEGYDHQQVIGALVQRLTPDNIVIRSFHREPIPIITTEESFRHYGPHQPSNRDKKNDKGRPEDP